MPAGPGQIIGSASTDVPYMMYVNNSGAVPVAGYNAGVVHPLLVDGAGALVTSASVSVGSIDVNVGSEAFMFGSSGTGWNSVLVDADGKLETTASVTVDSVYISSGADIGSVYLKDGATVAVTDLATAGSLAVQDVSLTTSSATVQVSGDVTFSDDSYINIAASGTTGIPVSGEMGRDWTLSNATDSVSISGLSVSVDSVFIASGANIGSVHVNNLTDLGSTVVIDSPATIGSLAIQTVDATDLDIRDLTSTDVVTTVQATQSNLKSEVYQGTDPWIVLGSAHVNNLTDLGSTVVIDAPSTIGSLAIQGVDITSAITIPVSGQMGRDWTLDNAVDSVSISGLSVSVDSVFIASGANIGSVHVNNLIDLGSDVTQGTSPWIVLGSSHINNLTDLGSSVTQGTDPWVVLGSTHINNLTDLGSTVVVDAPATIGSFAVQTIDGTISANVNNASTIGSYTTQIISGSVAISTDPVPVSGMTKLFDTSGAEIYFVGSPNYALPTSGAVSVTVDSVFIASGADIGSVYINNLTDLGSNVTQGTDPWIVLGSTQITNSLVEVSGNVTISDGAIVTVNNIDTAGSLAVQTIDAINLDIRDLASASDSVTAVQSTQANLKSEVYQGTDPWIILGSAHINNLTDLGSTVVVDAPDTIGSLAIQDVDAIGSVHVNNLIDLGSTVVVDVPSTIGSYTTQTITPSRGVFGYSGAFFIASGTVSNVISPGAGSKIMLKGFNASAQTASHFRIMFSGGNVISTFNLPSSGIVGMNMFGMEPSGATNEPLGVGMINAGSLNISVYTQDTL